MPMLYLGIMTLIRQHNVVPVKSIYFVKTEEKSGLPSHLFTGDPILWEILSERGDTNCLTGGIPAPQKKDRYAILLAKQSSVKRES